MDAHFSFTTKTCTKQGFEFLGTYRERMRICAVIRDLEVDMVEQDFMNEKRSAAREYEEQKVYLRDQLIHELEEKQRMIVSSKRFQNQKMVTYRRKSGSMHACCII